jgi:AcrR family transcriptional regulator
MYTMHKCNQQVRMPRTIKAATRQRILASVLKLMEGPAGAQGVTMRSVATSVGLTAMAIYKHFPDRETLLKAATLTEYSRLGKYFERANARTGVKGLRGMLGYLDYACDHPQVFRYMFATNRKDAFTYPVDLTAGKSPTLNILHSVVARMMEEGTLAQDDVFETSLAIWAHAHGLITLYLSDRIKMPRMTFRDLYMRSLNRLVDGIRRGPSNAVNSI